MNTYTIIVQNIDNTPETYTTKSAKKAYAIYDKAIAQGYAVVQFTSDSGMDYQDRTQEAIGWTA